MATDGEFVAEHGLLYGFDAVVWLIVVLNGLGGLLVAATMKYADNIVKCFAAALAILSGTLLSVPLFGFEPSRMFAVGAGCTVLATTLYSWAPPNFAAAAAAFGVGAAGAVLPLSAVEGGHAQK